MKVYYLIFFSVFCVCGDAWSKELPYRLAGTVMSSDGNRIAIVEIANREQKLLKIGDHLDRGVIRDIKEKSVVYELDEVKYVMNLKGAGLLAESGATHEDLAVPKLMTREFSSDTLERLKSLRQEFAKADEKEIRKNLNQILSLPDSARITSVNQESVEKPLEVLSRIIDSMENENLPRLKVEGISGADEVYMVPKLKDDELMSRTQ